MGASPEGGAGGAGIGGVHPSGSSVDCMKTETDATQKWIEHDVMVTVRGRVPAAVRDAGNTSRCCRRRTIRTRSYPVTFWEPWPRRDGRRGEPGHAGSGQTENYIQVMLLQETSCFSTSSADSPEVPYFDVALQGVEDGYCVDKSKVFVAGYSSGSWLTHLLACQRGNVIRGMGSASGGILEDHGTCTGAIAGIMTGDLERYNEPHRERRLRRRPASTEATGARRAT